MTPTRRTKGRKTAAERDEELVAKAGPWQVLDIGDDEMVVVPDVSYNNKTSIDAHAYLWLRTVDAAVRVLNRIKPIAKKP